MAVKTNWQNFRSQDSSLPPDVFFSVMKGDGEDEEEGFERIGAHKFLLAGTSPVFLKQFFGPMKETREVVEVKDTTLEAFGTMIDYVYQQPGEDTFHLNEDCPQKLFELHELAERYEILNLKTMTSSALENLTIRRENMIFTATVATKYKNIFKDLCANLLMRCLEFLFDKTNRAADTLALIMETKNNFPEASLDILYELITVGKETLQVPGISN